MASQQASASASAIDRSEIESTSSDAKAISGLLLKRAKDKGRVSANATIAVNNVRPPPNRLSAATIIEYDDPPITFDRIRVGAALALGAERLAGQQAVISSIAQQNIARSNQQRAQMGGLIQQQTSAFTNIVAGMNGAAKAQMQTLTAQHLQHQQLIQQTVQNFTSQLQSLNAQLVAAVTAKNQALVASLNAQINGIQASNATAMAGLQAAGQAINGQIMANVASLGSAAQSAVQGALAITNQLQQNQQQAQQLIANSVSAIQQMAQAGKAANAAALAQLQANAAASLQAMQAQHAQAIQALQLQHAGNQAAYASALAALQAQQAAALSTLQAQSTAAIAVQQAKSKIVASVRVCLLCGGSCSQPGNPCYGLQSGQVSAPIDITQDMMDYIRAQGMSITIDGVGGPLGAYIANVSSGQGIDILRAAVARFSGGGP